MNRRATLAVGAAALAALLAMSGPARPGADDRPPGSCTEAVERGKAQFTRGELDAALQSFEGAATLAEAAGTRACLGQALYRVGLVHDHRGEQAQAAEPLDRAEALGHAVGDRRLLAQIWNHRGLQSRLQANFDEAESYFRRSEAAFRALGDPVSASAALGNLGLVCQNRGDYVCGLDAHHRALELDPRNSYAFFNIAVIHEMQGEDALALRFYRRAAAVDRADGDVVHETLSVIAAGRALSRQGDAAGARDSFATARRVAERVGTADLLGELEYALGELDHQAGHLTEAERHFGEAVRLQQASTPPLADALQALSGVQLEGGQPAAALASARRSLELVDARTSWSSASGAWATVGEALESLGDLEPARAAYEQAVVLIENWRGHVAGEEPERQRFFEHWLKPYHHLLAMAVARGSPAEALRWAERARARVLVEVLQRGRVVGQRPLTPDQTAPEAETVTLEGLAPLLADGSAAVAFTVAEHATYAFAFTAQPDGSVSTLTATLPTGDAGWRTRARAFRAALARRDLGVRGMAGSLYRDLLGPLSAAIAGRRRLYLVPDGPMWEIPFAALQRGPQRYLLEDSALAVAPSLTALAAWRARPPATPAAEPWSFLGVGVAAFGPSLPPLPESARHTREVAALYGAAAHTLLNGEATEARVKADLGRARVLHFFTHGVVEPARPLYSALILAPGPAGSLDDGRLEAREILGLDLRADLAVLAACDTARGRVGAGEGAIGLSWALSVAGVRNTVVSLWSVDAASTARLMLEFHRASRRGDDYPEALRRAALALRGNPLTEHPFYWAPFVLVGDGRRRD